MRQFNDSTVIEAIRLHGPMPQSVLAAQTGLSVQAMALIIGRLEAEHLLLRLPPVRGKVGPPSIPVALNPDGAFFIGLAVGRRRMRALLMDFTGATRAARALDYPFPEPQGLFAAIDSAVAALRRELKPAWRGRLRGVGIAAPLSVGGWGELLGLAPGIAKAWEAVDMAQRVAALEACRGLDVDAVKDTTAACMAEWVIGCGRHRPTFLHIFVDVFIGGGLVIDGHLYPGAGGNAAALGSVSLGLGRRGRAVPRQLLGVASLQNLEARYLQAGLPADAWADDRALSAPWRRHTLQWLAAAGPAIALAVHGASCMLELDTVLVDGAMGRSLLDALVQAIVQGLNGYSWQGARCPEVSAGTVGPEAPAIGAALLPWYKASVPGRRLFG
ncbi:ROK family transcriptional regulator [Eleftheria terrae]|uniref:ROK family transcriptional regulator n=1 Tax=Eleftheria terrae TaxID=1597781 RepID=UPI00263B1F13|nr:ROK family transcriptional regulator [Eleftheria terrae]WKB55505.1 ROK family transcriptional regulator [Eleftheria terrae]